MAQTSVKWLHIELQKCFPKETSQMYNNNQLLYESIILKAKEMHKAECINFAEKWENGVPHDSKEDLYAEIFKK